MPRKFSFVLVARLLAAGASFDGGLLPLALILRLEGPLVFETIQVGGDVKRLLGIHMLLLL